MKRSLLCVIAAAAFSSLASSAFADTNVFSFAPDDHTAGVWGISDTRTGTTGSTLSIVNLPSAAVVNAPDGTSAARITTDSTNASMAEAGVSNKYGIVNSILSTLNVSYSYFKESTVAPASAPSLKLSFTDGTNSSTLVYEPYWNKGGSVTAGTWMTDTITANSGLFWTTAGFGQPNGAGGPPLHTLNEWANTYSPAFKLASLYEVKVGMGSYQPDQVGYFDKVAINGTAVADTTYNFASPTPLPASAVAGLSLFGALGVIGIVKRPRPTQA